MYMCIMTCFHRLVKLGSPYVNVMTVVGAVVFYVTVILSGVDENVASYTTVDGLCHARIWLASIGFSLLYGTVLAKTWRVYYIFSYTKPNSKLVSSLLASHTNLLILPILTIGGQRYIFVWNCWSARHSRYHISDTTYSGTKC